VTWTKLSDDFGEQCSGLSDAAYRTHSEALIWCMRRETDGLLSDRDVRRFAETADPDEAVRELLDHGFWRQTPTGFEVLHHMEHQPDSEVLAARRTNDAERQTRARRKAAGLDVTPSRRDTTRESRRDDTRDHPRDSGRVGSGRSGTTDQTKGAEKKETQDAHARTREPQPAPSAEPPLTPAVSAPLPATDTERGRCDCGWQLAPGEHYLSCDRRAS